MKSAREAVYRLNSFPPDCHYSELPGLTASSELIGPRDTWKKFFSERKVPFVLRITKDGNGLRSDLINRKDICTVGVKINGAFMCPLCGFKKVTRSGINSHLKTEHGKGGELQCNKCSYKTVSDQAYAAHLKACGTVIKCKQCLFTADRMSKMNRHDKIHQEPSFSCTKCTKQFRFRSNLAAHIQLHLRELQCDTEGTNM